MEMSPLVASAGTVVVICVSESTLKDASVPLNRTAVTVSKPRPVSVTAVPGLPVLGLNSLNACPAVTICARAGNTAAMTTSSAIASIPIRMMPAEAAASRT
jgi:hypothetical protein